MDPYNDAIDTGETQTYKEEGRLADGRKVVLFCKESVLPDMVSGGCTVIHIVVVDQQTGAPLLDMSEITSELDLAGLKPDHFVSKTIPV